MTEPAPKNEVVAQENCHIPTFVVALACLLPWFAALGFLAWVLILRFPMSGTFQVQTVMDGSSAFIFPFLPGERTSSPGRQADGWVGQRIIEDPVYMNVRTPGPYDTAEVEMDFRPIRQPLVEFGLVRDKEGKQLDLNPLYSQVLEDPVWQKTKTAGGVSGYVLSGVPSSRLDDKDTRGLAIWDATTSVPLMADKALGPLVTVNLTLRGGHDFWVVPAEGKIDFKMEVQDVNRNRSGGLMVVQVLYNEELVWQDTVGTSGSRDRGYGALIPVTISRKSLPPGVYRIKVTADDDVFIRSLTTRNPRWTVGPRLVVGDVVGFAAKAPNALTAWTTARHIVAETFHKEGLQDIRFGPMTASVKRTHTAVRADRTDTDSGLVTLTAPNGDIRLIADGYFSFSPEAFFEPMPRRLTPQTDAVKEGIQAVITDYRRVQGLGEGWYRTRMTFKIPQDMETLRFVVSAPGIGSRAGAVDVRRVAIVFRRPAFSPDTWWFTLWAELRRAWHRI